MKHGFLDQLSRLDSPIHRLPAWSKVVAALLVVAIAGIVRVPLLHAIIAILLIVAASLSKLTARSLLFRLLLFEPVMIGVAVVTLFRPDGVRLFGELLLRTNLALFAMILLSSTTPFAELLAILRKVKVPDLLITILALMYRYLFVIVDESGRMSRARASRTFGEGRAQRWRTTATILSQLLLRSTERAERIYAAMTARGWR